MRLKMTCQKSPRVQRITTCQCRYKNGIHISTVKSMSYPHLTMHIRINTTTYHHIDIPGPSATHLTNVRHHHVYQSNNCSLAVFFSEGAESTTVTEREKTREPR